MCSVLRRARVSTTDRFASDWLGSDPLTESKSLSFWLRNSSVSVVHRYQMGGGGLVWSQRGGKHASVACGRMLAVASLVGKGGGRLDGISSSACFRRACFDDGDGDGGGERRVDLDLVDAFGERRRTALCSVACVKLNGFAYSRPYPEHKCTPITCNKTQSKLVGGFKCVKTCVY